MALCAGPSGEIAWKSKAPPTSIRWPSHKAWMAVSVHGFSARPEGKCQIPFAPMTNDEESAHMKKFMAVYTGTPGTFERWQQKFPDAEARKAEEKKGMEAWTRWAKAHEKA